MPTPEQLKIVQALIDKGVPEEDILTVLDHWKSAGQPISASEPDTYLGGAMKGAVEGIIGGAKGFFKSIIPSTLSAANPVNIVKGTVGLGIDTLKGIMNLAMDPTKTLAATQTSLSKLPENAQKMISEALDTAAANPEAFGKIMADITGGAEVAVATARAVPMMPKPIALKVGESLARVGKAGEFAAYLTGAHQLASGDPKGAVTIALPGIMRAASKPLIRFGTVPSDVVPLAESIGAAEPLAAPARLRGPGSAQAYDPIIEQNTTPPSQTVKSPYTEAEQALMARAKSVGPPSAKGVRFGSFTNKAPIINPEVSPSAAAPSEALPPGQGPNGRPIAAQELAQDGSQRFLDRESTANKSVAEDALGKNRPLADLDEAAAAKRSYLNAVGDEAPVSSDDGMPADFTHEGSANYDPSNPPPGPSAGGSLGKFGEGLLASAGKPPEANLGTGPIDLTGPNVVPDEPLPSRALQVPAAEVPASKSRRTMSATPGLTRADVEGVGLNPDLPIKKLTPELVERIKANRSSRATSYRTDAGLNKGFVNALMQDSE